jgi:hypothetical protein
VDEEIYSEVEWELKDEALHDWVLRAVEDAVRQLDEDWDGEFTPDDFWPLWGVVDYCGGKFFEDGYSGYYIRPEDIMTWAEEYILLRARATGDTSHVIDVQNKLIGLQPVERYPVAYCPTLFADQMIEEIDRLRSKRLIPKTSDITRLNSFVAVPVRIQGGAAR